MRLPRRIILGLAVAVVLAACGPVKEPVASPSPAAGSPAPPGTDLVFKMQDFNGFAPPGSPTPMPLALYGDGRLIVTSNTAATAELQTALPNPQLRRLTPAGVQRFLQGAIAAGLTTTTDYGEPAAIDVGATRFVVVNQGRVHTVRVEGADFGSVAPGDPAAAARERLKAFRKQLKDLDSWLGAELSAAEPYSYPAMAVSNHPLGDVELPEGFPAPVHWPLDDLAASRCVVLTADRLAQAAKLASQTNAYAAWESNTKLYFLEFRPLLPDEKDCQSLPSQ